MTNENKHKNANKYACNICALNMIRAHKYVTFLSTSKHKIRTNTNKKVAKSCESCESCKKLQKVAKKYLSYFGNLLYYYMKYSIFPQDFFGILKNGQK